MNPGALYENASDAVRRHLLTAFFSKLVVYITDDRIRITSERHKASNILREIHGHAELARQEGLAAKTCGWVDDLAA